MTPENIRLSRPEPQPARPKPAYGGMIIESAEGVRWAYTDTPLPGSEGSMTEPSKVEGARMAAATILASEIELPLTPLPEPLEK